jgi:hypothetical protein
MELNFLRGFFTDNGYPIFIFERHVRNFLNQIFEPPPTVATVPKQQCYISLPFYGHNAQLFITKLQDQLSEIYPHLSIRFCQRNSFTIGSFFRFKDRIPREMLSNIIYEFKCRDCNASYIGSSHRKSKERIDQHLGISSRTGRPLTSRLHSLPRLHAEEKDHHIASKDFNIIATANSDSDLLPLESLYIFSKKTNLNYHQSATPLLSIQ